MNETNIEKNEILISFKVKVDFHYKEKTKVFIKTKSRLMYNGTIVEKYDNYFVLLDDYKKRNPISYTELEMVEPWIDKSKKENRKDG